MGNTSHPGPVSAASVAGRILACIVGLWSLLPALAASGAEPGQSVVFQIREPHAMMLQTVAVQYDRVKLKQAGGDPALDLLYDAQLKVLFLIDHERGAFYRFNQDVLDRIEAIMAVLGLADAEQIGTPNSPEAEAGSNDQTEFAEKPAADRSVGDIRCSVYRQVDRGTLEAEWCMATREGLSVLGGNYRTLKSFYDFGSRLLTQATVIFKAIGISVPRIRKPETAGLPVQVLARSGTLKVNLVRIREQAHPRDYFVLPATYKEVPIPFVS